MSDNNNVDVEEYIRNIIRDERKIEMVPIETVSRNRSVKKPMQGFVPAGEPAYFSGGPLGPAGE